jgi:hypothetical protein
MSTKTTTIATQTLSQAGAAVVLWLAMATVAVSPTSARQKRLNVVFPSDDEPDVQPTGQGGTVGPDNARLSLPV